MKKKNNKSEIALLAVLIIGFVFFGIYNYLCIPKSETIEALERELEALKAEQIDINAKIASIPEIENNLAAEEITARSGASMFFYDVVQENLILLMDDFSKKAPLKVISYGFTELSESGVATVRPNIRELNFPLKQMVEEYIEKYGTDEQKERLSDYGYSYNYNYDSAPPATNVQIAKTSVSISFQSTYNELMNYLKLFEDYNRKIVVNNLSISAQDANNVSGSMSVDFYELPKLFPKEADFVYSEWTQELPKGKDSPFGSAVAADISGDAGQGSAAGSDANNNGGGNNSGAVGGAGNAGGADSSPDTPGASSTSDASSTSGASGASGTSGTPASGENIPSASGEPDFFIIARSHYSDLPTMTIGLTADKQGETFIRDTSTGEQTITIELTEQDGKYYYSYGTDKLTYPRSGSNEFTPSDGSAVNIVIYSSRRSNDSDVNMLNVVINNGTRLKINAVINGDDSMRPRINVTEK